MSEQVEQNIEIIEQKITKIGGTNSSKKYQKGRFLGKGGFAKCYEATSMQTKKVYAIKIISKEILKKSKAKQKLVTQIKIHKSLNHHSVILFDHVFQDSQNVYIILQLCNNHTLNEMMKKRKRTSQLEVQYYLHQLIEGLQYLHSAKVIHRDLKLGNLMLSDKMGIKIGDFGLAAKLDYHGEKRKTICGTPNYLAPEIVNNAGHSYQVDIWSLGVIAYALLYGRPPFETSDVKKTYKKIKQGQYTFNEEVPISQNGKNLISRLLVLDPSKRLTLDQILTHPFMTNSKIPKELPVSVLTQPLPKNFVEQYSYCSNLTTNKLYHTSKVIAQEKGETIHQRAKSQKGFSQRILMRNSSGLQKTNGFTTVKISQKQQNFHSTPNQILSNNFFQKPQSATSKYRNIFANTNTTYVKKWVDYSSKYGLGYLLSEGSTGIFFNDSTKMVLDQKGQYFQYNFRKIDYIGGSCEDSTIFTFNANSTVQSKEISKKVTLMQYFRKYLSSTSPNEPTSKNDNSPPFVYVKKWLKSEQAILFRLNNKIIQVNFNDKSQIVIYCEKELMLYSNCLGKEKQILDINSPQIKKNHEISVRMQHVKSLLRKITEYDSKSTKTFKTLELKTQALKC